MKALAISNARLARINDLLDQIRQLNELIAMHQDAKSPSLVINQYIYRRFEFQSKLLKEFLAVGVDPIEVTDLLETLAITSKKADITSNKRQPKVIADKLKQMHALLAS